MTLETRLLKILWIVSFFALLGFFLDGRETQASRQTPEKTEQITLSFAPLVKKTSPAVVNVYAKRVVKKQQRAINPFFNDPFFKNFFGPQFGAPGLMTKRVQNSLGSGVIIDGYGGLIISNAHVIKGADEIVIILSDGREFQAKQIFLDEQIDLSLLKIETNGEILPSLSPVGDDKLLVGDLVLVIGNPFGVGQTVTSGIVSAVARTATGISDFNFFIQTDAAINPGNSGGALVDMAGNLVGVNTAIFSRSGGSLGIGFAIPSSMVRAVLASVKAGKKTLMKPWLGISSQKVNKDVAEALGLKRAKGALINDIYSKGPASIADLRKGDVILYINSKEVNDPISLRFELATLPLGQQVHLKIYRNGKYISKNIKTALPPEIPLRNETLINKYSPLRGAVVGNISPAVKDEYNLDMDIDQGVVILKVEEAKHLSLNKGDIVANVNGVDIKNVKQLMKVLNKNTRRWKVVINRSGKMISFIIVD